jgi:hypothetical protein
MMAQANPNAQELPAQAVTILDDRSNQPAFPAMITPEMAVTLP